MKKNLIITVLMAMALGAFASKPSIPLLDAAPFDTIIGGEKVQLYTLTNGKIAAQVTNYGAFLVGLYTPDKDGRYENIVTGYETIGEYLKYNLGKVGPIVGRYANRIKEGTFVLDGKEYHTTRNSGQHTLHGGTAGFDHVVWKVLKSSKKMLKMQCVLPDGADGFPGTLTTTLTYSITKQNGLMLEFEATTDKPTVVCTTCHSYFNLEGIGHGDIMNHTLTIKSDKITEADRSNIPTGKFLDVQGTPYDFRTAVRIGDRTAEMPKRGEWRPGQRFEIPEGKVMQYDNNFCLKHTDAKFDKVAVLTSPVSGRTMEVWNDHPGMQVYSGARTAIALESQMYPDSPNRPEFPSAVLRPGEVYKHKCEYRF